MYALYKKERTQGQVRYGFASQESLFGCNAGFIPWLLAKGLPAGQAEPCRWHLRVPEALSLHDYPESTLIIDIKPNNREPTLHLSELIDVWGYSANGWTPILLRTYPLFVEDDPEQHDRNDFTVPESDEFDPVYSTLYLQGTVENGAIAGTWNPPRSSPTNSALLWPDALRFFLAAIRDANRALFEQAAQQGAAADGQQRVPIEVW